MRQFLLIAAATTLLGLSARAEELSVAAWNVETFHFFGTCSEIGGNGRCIERTSSGSSAAVGALALRDDFNGFDVIAFSEVAGHEEAEVFSLLADEDEGAGYQHIVGDSGNNLRIAMIFASQRLELLESGEIDMASASHGSRKPLAARFRTKVKGTEFWVVAVHLTRGNTQSDGSGSGDIRNDAQSEELRVWIDGQTIPVIAVGDFNYDVNFVTERVRIGFETFLEGDVVSWVEPDLEVDTNWAGEESDRFPNSILDFVFVSGEAKSWQSRSVVYERPGDFPDTWRTADHRPVVAFFETDAGAPFNVDLTERLPKLVDPDVSGLTRSAGLSNTFSVSEASNVAEKLQAADRALELETREAARLEAAATTFSGMRAPGARLDPGALLPEDMLNLLADMVAERLSQQ